MANFDFTGNFPYADAEGTLALSPDSLYWDDIATLVQNSARLTVHREPRRRGNYSLKITTLDDDVSSGPNERTELFVNVAGRNLYGPGDKFWWGTSVWLPADFPALSSWLLISQLHGSETGPPEWAVELTGETIQHTIRGGNIDVGGDTDWPRYDNYVAWDPDGGLPRERWIDIRCYTELSTGPDGVNKMWVRLAGQQWPDTPQVDVTGVNVVSIAGDPLELPPPRLGIYRDHRTDETSLFTPGNMVKQSPEALKAGLWDEAHDLAATIQADDPLAHLPLSEAAGTFANLGSAGGAVGTLVGAATRAAATLTRDGVGAGVTLASGQYISCGDIGLDADEGSIEAIVNVGANGGRAMVSAGNSADADSRLELEVNFTSPGFSHVSNAGAAQTYTIPSGIGYRIVPLSRLHHLLLRWSAYTGRIEMFVNGEMQTRQAYAPAATTLDRFTIGARNAAGTFSRHGGTVTMQHVAAYAQALSDARVNARWAAATREALSVAPLVNFGPRVPRLVKIAGQLVDLAA